MNTRTAWLLGFFTSAVLCLSAAASDAPGRTLLLRNGRTGAALPAAHIVIASGQMADFGVEADRARRALAAGEVGSVYDLARVRELGQTFVADEHGIVHGALDQSLEDSAVIGLLAVAEGTAERPRLEAGALYIMESIMDMGSGPVLLDLFPRTRVEISLDQPARTDLPVQVWLGEAGAASETLRAFVPAGASRLSLALPVGFGGMMLAGMGEPAPNRGELVVTAGVSPALEDAVQVPFVRGAEPSVVQLKEPATGSIEVRLDVPPGWEAIVRETPVWLMAKSVEGEARDMPRTLWSTRMEAGVARIEGVCLGGEFDVVLQPGMLMLKQPLAQGSGAGPTAAGETAVIELDAFGGAQVALGARLVDESKRPLAHRAVRCVPASPGGFMPGFVEADAVERQTGAEGHLTFLIDDHWNAAWWSLEVPTEGGPTLRAIVHSPDGAGPLVELGDVVLQAPRLLASGSIVDSLGAPMPGRPARLAWLADPDADVAATANDDWFVFEDLIAETDNEGRFEIHGVPPSVGQFQITTIKRTNSGLSGGVIGETVKSFPLVGAELVLPARGGIAGQVRLGDELREELGGEALWPDLAYVSYEQAGKKRWSGIHGPGGYGMDERLFGVGSGPDAEGRFRHPDLEPGLYTVQVHSRWTGEVLAEVPGITVHAGRITENAWTEALELDENASLASLEIVDENGRRIPRAQLIGDNFQKGPTVPTGRVRFLTLKTGFEVEVHAAGFANAKIVIEPGENRIELSSQTQARPEPESAPDK